MVAVSIQSATHSRQQATDLQFPAPPVLWAAHNAVNMINRTPIAHGGSDEGKRVQLREPGERFDVAHGGSVEVKRLQLREPGQGFDVAHGGSGEVKSL